MKKYSILLLAALLLMPWSLRADDARQRTAATIVADALAQLPANNQKKFNSLMGELASTGAEGVAQLAGMLVPAESGKNSTVEYALNGLVAYVHAPGREAERTATREALRSAIETVTDNPNRAFLMTLLQRCGTAEDVPFFARYATDPYLQEWAVGGLASIEGSDDELIGLLLKSDEVPLRIVAPAVARRNIRSAEPLLLESLAALTSEADAAPVYKALARIGSSKSERVMAKAAKAQEYALGPNSVTEAYTELLTTMVANGEAPAAVKAAKKLLKSAKSPAVRGAALNVICAGEGKKAMPVVMNALKDYDRSYRVSALRRAEPWADIELYGKLDKFIKSNPDAEASADILNWYGHNHVATSIDAVVDAMSSKNPEVASAAIKAAARIGGDKALAALAALLGTEKSAEAEKAMLSFNGRINPAVMNILNKCSGTPVCPALRLASTRRMTEAVPRVFALVASSDSAVSAEAYKALAGVVNEAELPALCVMMGKAQECRVPDVQRALASAVRNMNSDSRYAAAVTAMSSSRKPERYYPLLALAGTPKAQAELLRAYEQHPDEAFAALLAVDSPDMIPTLYNIAQADTARSGKALERYCSLVAKSGANNVRKYQLYRRGLEVAGSPVVQKRFLSQLAKTVNYPALTVAARYLGVKGADAAAAAAVSTIASKNKESFGGAPVRKMLEDAVAVYRTVPGADAGYAIDNINGMLAKLPVAAYEPVEAPAEIAKGKTWKSPASYENFEMIFDWRGAAPKVGVRSMNGVCSLDTVVNAGDEWNTTYVKMLNDRLTVENNGVVIVRNKPMMNGNKPVNVSGFTSLAAPAGGAVQLREMMVRQLPSTPVFTLSPEEKAEGFKVLFDGRSMHNWTGNTTDYIPVDGNIYVTAQYGGAGNLYTKEEFGDFVLRFEFCFVREGVNNGIGIRTPMGVDAAFHGMEIQVLDHDAPIYKNLNPYQVHGSVYGVIPAKRIKHPGLGQWETEEIRAVGDHITVTVNGEVILDGNIREACQGHNVAPDGGKKNPYMVDHRNHPGLFNKRGHIGFLGHGAGVKFRNVRIKPLD